jgi:biopolymer transport protein ExbD
MPKHKPKRSGPSLDMTAMCDVAFLLLTFFILTAKAKPQETVTVDTPSSISEAKLPEVGTLTVLVSKEGDVFLDPAGAPARRALIATMNDQYKMGLSTTDQNKFVNMGSFGASYQNMKKLINAEPSERKKYATGIPIDTVDINNNELANWLHQARLAQFRYKQEMIAQGKSENDVKEYAIVVKADKDTPYLAIQKVINTLTDINLNKFNLITSQEGDPNKTDAVK